MTDSAPAPAAPAAAAGDLGVLFTALHPELLRHARAAGASTQDAEDAVADAFLDFARRPAGTWPQQPRAYLHAVVRNTVRRRGASAREVPTAHEALDRPAEDVDRLESGEQTAAVAQALASLTTREQRLLVGSLIQGLAVERLGAELGLSTTATTTALARARARLRTAYLAAQLEPQLAACGGDPVHLARVLLHSASERMRARVERHSAHCRVCRGLLDEPRTPRIGRSALIVSLELLGRP